MPDEAFAQEEEFVGPVFTVGELAQAHVTNTIALRRANNKLSILCLAAGRAAPLCGES